MTDRGKFITLEGIEGTGKSTQCALLCDYLRGHGVDVVETREPGGTALGESIRMLLLSPKGDGPSARAELLLFLAARAQLVTAYDLSDESVEKIRDALAKLTGNEVALEVETDPSLIGGVVTKVGDLVLDGSIKTQLLNMKETLKRSETV